MSFLNKFFNPNIKKMTESHDVGGLIKALECEDLTLCQRAASALGDLGDVRAVEPLISVLENKEKKEARVNAAYALGKISDERAVEPLIAALNNSEKYLCSSAANSLASIGDLRAINPLAAVLRDKGNPERGSVVMALERFGAPAVNALIQALKSGDPDVSRWVTEALGKVGAPAVESLLAAMRDAQIDRSLTTEALKKIGAPAVEPLIAVVNETNNDSMVRQSAIEVLTSIKDQKAVLPLIATISDTDKDIRRCALRALGNFGDVRAKEPLMNALKDSDTEIRDIAVEAIIKLGVDVQTLKNHYDPNLLERFASFWASQSNLQKCVEMGSLAVPPLCEILKKGPSGYVDSYKRDLQKIQTVIKTLGEIGDAYAIPLIFEQAQKNRSANPEIAAAAFDAMIDIGHKTPATKFDEYSKYFKFAMARRLIKSHILLLFVREKNGTWNHEEWQILLQRVRAAHICWLSDGEIGSLLEAVRDDVYQKLSFSEDEVNRLAGELNLL